MVKANSNDLQPGLVTNQAASLLGDDKTNLIMAVTGRYDTLFNWNYEIGENASLDELYKKAKLSQWDSDLDIDWGVSGQIDRARDPRTRLNYLCASEEGAFGRLNAKERAEFGHASISWTISQFLHAEQGALACAAKLAQAAPDVSMKLCASTQVMEEARHMEVYAKYLREKLEWEFPINPHLRSLLNDIISDSRWDFTFLGMQVVIEGLALAAFSIQYRLTKDPLLKQITRYIMADEARHVAFGVLSLREIYSGLSASELRERQEFCYECALRMRDRFLGQEVWEALGLPVNECLEIMKRDPVQIDFRRTLFTKVVPSVKRLGLLDFGDGWLRTKFAELGVLAYEHLEDASSEHTRMDLDHAPWSVIQYKHY